MERMQDGPDPPPGVHLWLVLWRTFDAVREYAHRNVAALGLGLTDFGVLEALLHKGPLPVNTIGAKVRLTSGSISVAVDRLEAKGLVERRADAEDRRTRMVRLTPRGRKLIGCAFAAHAGAMEKLAAAALTPGERSDALRLLRKLGRASQGA